MSEVTLTKQYIFDAAGVPVGVILPIEEYNALTRENLLPGVKGKQLPQSPLYGALRHLKGTVASTEEIDETLRELWSSWDKEQPE